MNNIDKNPMQMNLKLLNKINFPFLNQLIKTLNQMKSKMKILNKINL